METQEAVKTLPKQPEEAQLEQLLQAGLAQAVEQLETNTPNPFAATQAFPTR